jgi:hypothetical protein
MEIFMAQSQAHRTETGEQTESATRRPVDTARVGNVEIAVWKNHGQNGDFFPASAPTIAVRTRRAAS